MSSHLEEFYSDKLNQLSTRKKIIRWVTLIFILISIWLVFTYISSVEEVTIDRAKETYEKVEEYYKHSDEYNSKGFTEETLKQLVNINTQVINNGKSLLDSLLGYLTLIFSAISVALINYYLQLDNKIIDYEEKQAIEISKNQNYIQNSTNEDVEYTAFNKK